ncbi:predicted protein [Micromonas commoda]|uniref:Dymeclin n=1 Tax=Micromonas commoda (strain RCC299 / NOUM17 / CCMP2709) TaxID=296587 RepID=C1FEV8_MICCC|nr:predicted protein [Micromonas commoda]ACO68643.1 predicted protein [Micromonas commoda]|eukprot:XP_002507385.1 predicted protein [Micromonas commoda]
MGAGSSTAAAAYARCKDDVDANLARLSDPDPTTPDDPTWDELLRFPAAITSASDADLDVVLGRVDFGSIAPGTLDALLERAAAALRRCSRSDVAGSNPSRGDVANEDRADDAWTAAINATTLATRALRRCSRDTLRFLCRRRRQIANDDDDAPDESGGVATAEPAVCDFMAAVVDVVAGCADERAPRGCHVYALRVACCRSLEAIADEYSTADDSKADSSSPLSTPSAPFANETDGEFDAFDVLMDAVDGCTAVDAGGDGRSGESIYRDVVAETLRLWSRRPPLPRGSDAWMHDPNDASGKPRGGFLGAMAALLLGDDDDDDDNGDDDKGKDWDVSVFSPLGDAAGAALTRLLHRPARYDGVAEVGRCVANESASTAVVSTAGKVVRREPNVAGSSPGRSAGIVKSSREKWGGGLGEVETVMRRASMDVDDDPGSPVGSSRSPFAPPGFDSGADRSGLVFSKNYPPETPPATGSSIAANPFRDALFRLVRLERSNKDDDSGESDALRVRVLRACVLAMHSADTAGAASGASGDKSHAASCQQAAVGVFLAYSLLYGNEGFYRAVVADANAVRALVSALLRRAHATYAEVGGSSPRGTTQLNVSGVASVATATLAMLSQDPVVNRAVHSLSTSQRLASSSNDSQLNDSQLNDSQLNDRTDFWFNSSASAKTLSGFKSIGKPPQQTLGSAWVLVLCRVARGGGIEKGDVTSGEGGIEPATSSFARACALAALANSAPYFDGLTSAASQRLVAVFDVLHRRRRKRVSAAMGRPGIEPGSDGLRGRTGLPTAVAALVSAALASALVTSASKCPELVYAALQRRDEVFAPFLDEFLDPVKDRVDERKDSNPREGLSHEGFHANDPELELAIHRMREHAVAIHQRLEFFNARVDAAREASTNHRPGSHWTMDKAMDVIRAACEEDQSKEDHSKEDHSSTSGSAPPSFQYAPETFVYREEIDAHEFFRPIVDLALSGRRR